MNRVITNHSTIDISELVESVDILDYISQYTEFEEQNGEFWALSPLKNENTPSFSVRREANQFYDFSSGVGGDIITFIRHYDKCGFIEAVEKLKTYSGFSGNITSRRNFATVDVAKRFTRARQREKTDKSVCLPDDYMQRYERREDKLDAWRAEGISDEVLERFQVRYDAFSDCIVYPIRTPDGKIVNVGGRTLNPDWKAKKIRKYTYFFPWGEMKTIYGLAENREQIKKTGEIILFEGAKSVLLAATYGIQNAGAILTSHINPNQRDLLAGLGCRVVFALDKDVDIRQDHNIKLLRQYVNVEYIYDRENLIGEKDSPIDRGEETWKRLYEGRLIWR